MGNLFAYSAITAKIHAMKHYLLTKEDYLILANQETVTQALQVLQNYPRYQTAFHGIHIESLHRSDIEKILLTSTYHDFSKLHHFSNHKQRKFLELYFMHYEISLLKRILRACLNHRFIEIDFHNSKSFFKKHSHLDFDAIMNAQNISEFVESLKGSEYYESMYTLSQKEGTTIFEYETQMDHLYFHRLWKAKDTYLSSSEHHAFTELLGSRIDLLNLLWIYRSKKYYHLSNVQTYSLLVPIYYKLSIPQVQELVEAIPEDFFTLLSNSYYGRIATKLHIPLTSLEILYESILMKVHDMMVKKDPYSIANVSTYLYRKEVEIENLISIFESVRYQLPIEQILSKILIF